MIFIIIVLIVIYNSYRIVKFNEISTQALEILNLKDWEYRDYDSYVRLKSSRAVDDYNAIKYIKEEGERLGIIDKVLKDKKKYSEKLSKFLSSNDLSNRYMYSKLEDQLTKDISLLNSFNVYVQYTSPAGRSTNNKILCIGRDVLDDIVANPSLIMSKSEYNKYVKEEYKEALNNKHHSYYDKVNNIIDLANKYRDNLINDDDKERLDSLISSLFDRTVNKIKRMKTIESDEWTLIDKVINSTNNDIKKIITLNQKILDYYSSSQFKKIKNACKNMMESQKEFNDYINEKANSLSSLFGTRVVRNDTINNDEYNYIRPYRKSITPYTAEVSASVFASAENHPLEYIIKFFYPNKDDYPNQIKKLQLLVEEIETLKDARIIIDNYKKEYQKYIIDVPSYVMENDEDGFYQRLGFANISESALTIEYKFSYTSGGGMAQRFFTIPMTEDTIIELIKMLQSKLTLTAFVKEQRLLMTSKLRQFIKERDNYTCKNCGNSTLKEPNLLLEIDHIIPVSKGGVTTEDNLQTLCWKCNRAKSSKIT